MTVAGPVPAKTEGLRAKPGAHVVWIVGATHGIGTGLAELADAEGARVVNLDLARSDRYETLGFDLVDPQAWDEAANHFCTTLAKDRFDRATLLVVGHANIGQGLLSKVALEPYRASLVANAIGPIMLGTMFLRSLPDDVAGGLMLMSSGSAARPVIGQSAYSAAKCAIEGWVRVAREELVRDERNAWVVAVRPGFVDTPGTRALAQEDIALYPRARKLAENVERFAVSIAVGAERIWRALPPPEGACVLSFDGGPEDGIKILH